MSQLKTIVDNGTAKRYNQIAFHQYLDCNAIQNANNENVKLRTLTELENEYENVHLCALCRGRKDATQNV